MAVHVTSCGDAKLQARQRCGKGHLHTDCPTRELRHVTRASRGGEASEEEIPDVNPLISSNPQFAAALKDAMKRSGRGALTKNAPPAEPKHSPGEEVLVHALRQSRRTILRLERAQKELAEALEQENKQFERIQFGLKRATADAAYIKTLQKLRAESRGQDGSA